MSSDPVAGDHPACAGPTLVDLGIYPANERFSFSLTQSERECSSSSEEPISACSGNCRRCSSTVPDVRRLTMQGPVWLWLILRTAMAGRWEARLRAVGANLLLAHMDTAAVAECPWTGLPP